MKSKVKEDVPVPIEGSPSQLGYQIASGIKDNSSKSMRLILTQIEATLGDTKQAESFKKVVKHEFYRLMDHNQHLVYNTLGVERFDPLRANEPNDEVTMPLNSEE